MNACKSHMRPKFRAYSHCQNIIYVEEISKRKYNRILERVMELYQKVKNLREREMVQLDGYVARRTGVDSIVGTYLDPLADKVSYFRVSFL